MRQMRVLLLTMMGIALAFPFSSPQAVAPDSPPTLATLQPGGFRTIAQTLHVNVVFVGYEAGAGAQQVNAATFTSALPASYRPRHRYPNFYGLPSEMGLTFNFAYHLTWATDSFEDDFFGYLASIATDKPLTAFQSAYNDQAPKAETVTDNAWIDAPSVEKWLADHAPVDTSKYTIFFINWYGRPDFQYHVYTKTNEVDPDTGYNFGEIRDSRKIIAWGGTAADDPESGLGSTHRIWFHDLSAGPESWTDNWDIVNKDVDGNGQLDYRMPPIWEYGNPSTGTYRPFDSLSWDLGLITRFVAIDLLFTTSPLYKPMISPPKVPGTIDVDLNVYQADPAVDGTTFLDAQYLLNKLGPLQPSNAFTAEVTSQSFSARAAQVYNCFVTDVTCFGSKLFRIAFADLFLYHDDHLTEFIEGDPDYEVPVFLYNTTDALSAGGLLGFADDNWRDGTQSYVFGFLAPFLRTLGYGLTTTSIHEVGHHLGMSHPHDGFDPLGIDFGPSDAFYFTWAGDESNTVMSYLDLNFDFGQFDRDNMARYLTIGYINQANTILSSIYASPRAGNASAALTAADAQAAGALSAYAAMNYATAAARAKLAFLGVLAAADIAGVKVEPQNYTADYKAKGRSPKFVDTVDYHRSRP
jgi:hypothetical protein